MSTPRLYGTPLSHFTRKLRVLFAELDLAYEFVRTPSVLATTADAYGDNPLMRVPALHLDGELLLESDHIARVMVARFAPDDRLGMRSERVDELNRLAVVNGIMSHEVVLLLAKRSGLTDLDRVVYFRKLTDAIEGALVWLDAHTPDDDALRYADIATVCMWQHLLHFHFVTEPERFAALTARVARFADRPAFSRTTPVASLAEADAAGWTPG